MNIEKQTNSTKTPAIIDDIDFDFRPITSGLGFHQKAAQEIKPVFTDRTVATAPAVPQMNMKKEMNVYQNDLSLFYGQAQAPMPVPELKVEEEKYFRLASGAQRVSAYILDLLFLSSVLAMLLTIMARTIHMDLLEVWQQYPNEITPLFVTLFCGFYLIYFSIFEKTNQSTIGKNIFQLRVLKTDNQALTLFSLLARSSVSLLNFISLGLFSYFDLQNKVTSSKVIRIE